jgi:Family of unknown function (DUF6298)
MRSVLVSVFPYCFAAVLTACGSHGTPLRETVQIEPAKGPLKISSVNPRYFSDGSGKPIFLAGAHTWNNFQDWGTADPPPVFDYPGYLAFLRSHSLNFYRLWTWEQADDLPWSQETVRFTPLPYLRTGPGTALDGGPKFDLTRFNEDYFARLHKRVRAAGEQGIYVSIMLFNGFSVADKSLQTTGKGNPWRNHPYNRANNINGIDGDLNDDGQGFEVHTLRDPKVVALEEAYVAKVVNTVQDLDNVLYEISNESDKQSRDWEYEMIRFIHTAERGREKQHPVGMTVLYPDGNNADLWASPADWIAPNDTDSEPYKTVPPASSGRKVVVADTDHLWGIGGNVDWVWKSFCRGLNTLFMDPYQARLPQGTVPLFTDLRTDERTQSARDRMEWEAIRRNLGYTRLFAKRMDFAAMSPQPSLASTGYCLANAGSEYLVYVPRARWRYSFLRRTVTVDLSAAPSTIHAEWFNPASGDLFDGGSVHGGGSVELKTPFWGAAVLHLSVDRRLNP